MSRACALESRRSELRRPPGSRSRWPPRISLEDEAIGSVAVCAGTAVAGVFGRRDRNCGLSATNRNEPGKPRTRIR